MKTSSASIKRLSKKVHDTTDIIKKKNRDFSSTTTNISSWWKGKASDALKKENAQIKNDFTKITRNLGDLQRDLNRLARLVERIENKR